MVVTLESLLCENNDIEKAHNNIRKTDRAFLLAHDIQDSRNAFAASQILC